MATAKGIVIGGLYLGETETERMEIFTTVKQTVQELASTSANMDCGTDNETNGYTTCKRMKIPIMIQNCNSICDVSAFNDTASILSHTNFLALVLMLELTTVIIMLWLSPIYEFRTS